MEGLVLALQQTLLSGSDNPFTFVCRVICSIHLMPSSSARYVAGKASKQLLSLPQKPLIALNVITSDDHMGVRLAGVKAVIGVAAKSSGAMMFLRDVWKRLTFGEHGCLDIYKGYHKEILTGAALDKQFCVVLLAQ